MLLNSHAIVVWKLFEYIPFLFLNNKKLNMKGEIILWGKQIENLLCSDNPTTINKYIETYKSFIYNSFGN